MRKFNTRLFAGLLAVFCCMTALSATAYADGGYYEQSEDGSETPPSSIDSITISTETVRLPEQQGSEALTPDGNLTLIDDILQSAPYASVEEAAENKQFITVQSKNGNYFYIVIDRSGDTENVYFLNLVDEADLMALLEELDIDVPDTTPESTPTPKPTVEVVPEPDEPNGVNSSILLIVFALLVGGVILYYFKVIKKKPKQKVPSYTDEYDMDDDDIWEKEV